MNTLHLLFLVLLLSPIVLMVSFIVVSWIIARVTGAERTSLFAQSLARGAAYWKSKSIDFLVPWYLKEKKDEIKESRLAGAAIWRLVILVVSLVIVFGELPIWVLRSPALYSFLRQTPLLPFDTLALFVGLLWLCVPGVFALWLAETVKFMPEEVGLFPYKNWFVRVVCGVIASAFLIFSVIENYRLTAYTQCLLVQGCQSSALVPVSIAAGFNVALILAGVLSFFGLIYGLIALAALFFSLLSLVCSFFKHACGFMSKSPVEYYGGETMTENHYRNAHVFSFGRDGKRLTHNFLQAYAGNGAIHVVQSFAIINPDERGAVGNCTGFIYPGVIDASPTPEQVAQELHLSNSRERLLANLTTIAIDNTVRIPSPGLQPIGITFITFSLTEIREVQACLRQIRKRMPGQRLVALVTTPAANRGKELTEAVEEYKRVYEEGAIDTTILIASQSPKYQEVGPGFQDKQVATSLATLLSGPQYDQYNPAATEVLDRLSRQSPLLSLSVVSVKIYENEPPPEPGVKAALRRLVQIPQRHNKEFVAATVSQLKNAMYHVLEDTRKQVSHVAINPTSFFLFLATIPVSYTDPLYEPCADVLRTEYSSQFPLSDTVIASGMGVPNPHFGDGLYAQLAVLFPLSAQKLLGSGEDYPAARE